MPQPGSMEGGSEGREREEDRGKRDALVRAADLGRMRREREKRRQ